MPADDIRAQLNRLEGMITAFVEESHARDAALADKDVSTANAMKTIEARVSSLEQRPRVGNERATTVTVEGPKTVRAIRIEYADDADEEETHG